MCRVDELIEKLKILPPETEVSVLEVRSINMEIEYDWVELDLNLYSETFQSVDFSKNPFVQDTDLDKNTKILLLGEC